MLKLVSWNMAHRAEAWRALLQSDADVALLQEAGEPPPDVAPHVDAGGELWQTDGAGVSPRWRTAVVRLNPHLRLDRIQPASLADAHLGDLPVSRRGTIAAARVTDPATNQEYTLVSMYAVWENPVASTQSRWIYADASAHRLISDISALVGHELRHRLIAAGDLNLLHGYGEDGSPYWAARYATVFARLEAIGLNFIGPQRPNGRQADPWPSELPSGSTAVPTFHHNRQTPATATRQLDFVFASKDIDGIVKTYALNHPEEWGPSDHCRVRIDVG